MHGTAKRGPTVRHFYRTYHTGNVKRSYWIPKKRNGNRAITAIGAIVADIGTRNITDRKMTGRTVTVVAEAEAEAVAEVVAEAEAEAEDAATTAVRKRKELSLMLSSLIITSVSEH